MRNSLTAARSIQGEVCYRQAKESYFVGNKKSKKHDLEKFSMVGGGGGNNAK